jgi:hypothetical protein
VAISPDLGERYLDTVYQSNWLQDLYGGEVIGCDEGVEVTNGQTVRMTHPAWDLVFDEE